VVNAGILLIIFGLYLHEKAEAANDLTAST